MSNPSCSCREQIPTMQMRPNSDHRRPDRIDIHLESRNFASSNFVGHATLLFALQILLGSVTRRTSAAGQSCLIAQLRGNPAAMMKLPRSRAPFDETFKRVIGNVCKRPLGVLEFNIHVISARSLSYANFYYQAVIPLTQKTYSLKRYNDSKNIA